MKAEEMFDCLEEINGMIYKLYEKTIPQKVRYDPFGAECPKCGVVQCYQQPILLMEKKIDIRCDYCYSCGQALEWSSK